MTISEMSRRTGVTPRMLRYYEEQGLVTPERQANGYRDYPEHLVDRVLKVKGLLESGIPTRIIADMLPCLGQQHRILVVDPDPQLRGVLLRERDRMAERVRILEQSLAAITSYIEAMDHAVGDVRGPGVGGR